MTVITPCTQQNKELLNNERWATVWDNKNPIIRNIKAQVLGGQQCKNCSGHA